MISAYELSDRIQSLRLHSWALQREGLKLPKNIDTMSGSEKYRTLAQSILEHDLKASGFEYTLTYDWDYYLFRVELPTVAKLVDQACAHKVDFPATYFAPPRRERDIVQLYLYDEGLWVLDQQVDELRKDLIIYRNLEETLTEQKVKAASNPDENLEHEFMRNLRWNRQVRMARTPLQIQRVNIQEIMASYAPDLEEHDGSPVRVEVTEGQSLEEAIFVALNAPATG